MEESDHRVVAETPDALLSISQDVRAIQEDIGEIPVVDESSFKASIVKKLHDLLPYSKTARLPLPHPVIKDALIEVVDVESIELDESHEEEEKDAEGNPVLDAEGNPKKIKNRHVKLLVSVGAGVVVAAWFTVYEVSRAINSAKPPNKKG